MSRLRARLRRLLDDGDPASLLASWLASAEAVPVLLSAHPGDLRAVLADSRVVPSGISDPRSNLAVSDQVEAWVSRAEFDGLVADHMLASEGERNVRLHITDAPMDNPVALGRLLADLSAHPGPREADAVHRLLHEAASAPRVLRDAQ